MAPPITTMGGAERFACPCLNINLRGRRQKAASDSPAPPGIPFELSDKDSLTAEYLVLVQASFVPEDEGNRATLRCLNCVNPIARYVPPTGSDPATLPADGRIVLSEHCISGDDLIDAQRHESYSHAFGVLLEPPNAPGPHLTTSSPRPSTSPTSADPVSVPSPSPGPVSSHHPSPIRPRHAQSNPTAAIGNRLTQSVRAHRAQTDQQIALLRRKTEDYALKATKEAEVLAARAGIQRGGFTGMASLTTPPSNTQAPDSRTSPSKSPPTIKVDHQDTTSPTRAISITTSAQSTGRSTEGARRNLPASPYPAPVIRPPLPAASATSALRPSASSESRPPRTIKFEEPQPVHAPVVLATSSSAGDLSEKADEDGDEIFELDEELSEPSQSEESDSGATDAPDTQRITSPDRVVPRAPHSLSSPSDMDASKATQARQLRDLLATDLPSHRTSGRRRSARADGTDEKDDIAVVDHDVHSTASVATPPPPAYGTSVPIDISPVETRASGVAVDATMSPELSRPSSRPNGATTAAVPKYAASLRDATEKALAHAAAPRSPPPSTASTGSVAQTIDFSKSPPEASGFAGSYRGRSSLTSALLRRPSATTESVRQLPPMTEEIGASEPEEAEAVNPDHTFVPPHMLSRLSRGDEGLLSTSVRDLYE